VTPVTYDEAVGLLCGLSATDIERVSNTTWRLLYWGEVLVERREKDWIIDAHGWHTRATKLRIERFTPASLHFINKTLAVDKHQLLGPLLINDKGEVVVNHR
jgi:hypothetical protein